MATKRPYDMLKRAIDVVFGTLALGALSPVLLATAWLVRRNLGSPVFFRQQRPGRDGEPFELLKFRSMLDGDGDDAQRLTPFGKKLRASSLDELPELINVIRGDMSLVGPRPLLMSYLPLYDERQARRHEVRPGISGLAQASGRNGLSWPERFEMDVDYVERRSLRLDVQIVLKTIWQVINRTGINADGEATMAPFAGL